MALDAEKRIPDTTLPANSFKDGDILYGSDMNRVVDTLKTAVNENYKDLKGAVKGGDSIYINPIEGVVDSEGQPIDTVDGLIKWLYDNKILNEGKIYSLRINDSKQFEYYDGESWKLATVGQQGEPGEGVPTGGLSGQFLIKQSDVSYDTEWVDAYDKSQVDTFIANLNNATRINLLRPTLQTQTLNGVTFTYNEDGTYTLNGTSTATFYPLFGKVHLNKGIYKLLGSFTNEAIKNCLLYIAIGSNIIYDMGNGINFEVTSEVDCLVHYQIFTNRVFDNVVIKPMITTNLNATDDDFVSYEDSLATNRIIATRVNLLKPKLQTSTQNNVICTNNGDGTYTLNGTATNATSFCLMLTSKNIYGGMKMLGTPKGINGKNARVTATYYDENKTWATFNYDDGDGAIIMDNYPYIMISIDIEQNETLNNVVFKPMITTNLNATYDDFIACLGTSWAQDTTNGYYTQSIICSGITSKDNPPIDVVLSGTLAEMQTQQEEWGKILKVETSTDTLTFYASEPTTISLSMMVKGV